MAVEVTVEEDAKSRLEELQAEIRLRTGQKVTQQELLSRLIEDAYESREEFIDSFRSSTVPLSKEEKATMREGRVSSGVDSEEDDIDSFETYRGAAMGDDTMPDRMRRLRSEYPRDADADTPEKSENDE